MTWNLPAGKLTVCYGKSPFIIGKSTINEPFSIAMLNYQRVNGHLSNWIVFQLGFIFCLSTLTCLGVPLGQTWDVHWFSLESCGRLGYWSLVAPVKTQKSDTHIFMKGTPSKVRNVMTFHMASSRNKVCLLKWQLGNMMLKKKGRFRMFHPIHGHFSGKDDDIPVEFCVPHFETETRISLIQHTSTRAGRYATMWSSMPMPGPTRKAGCSDSMRFDESWMQMVFFNRPEFMLTGSKRSYCLNLTSK